MKKILFVICILASAILVMVAVAETASAAVVTVPLEDFLIFSGGGWVSTSVPGTGGANSNPETAIAGASLYIGNIGSNYDLALGASDTQVLGSVYAGATVSLAQQTAIGSDGNQSTFDLEPPMGTTYPTYPQQWEVVVANGKATINNNTKIWGTLDAASWTTNNTPTVGHTLNVLDPSYYTISPTTADTFARISMPTVSITAGSTPKTEADATAATPLGPGSYGTLITSNGSLATHTKVYLQSGDYYFQSISLGSYNDLYIDLTSGPVNINIVGDFTTDQDAVLYVKDAGTGGFVKISEAPELAGRINWTLGGSFNVGGGDVNTFTSIFGGIVYSGLTSGDGVVMDQHIDWYGALYAYDKIDLADHSRYTYVAGNASIPEPSTLLLLGSGLIGLVGYGRKRFKK